MYYSDRYETRYKRMLARRNVNVKMQDVTDIIRLQLTSSYGIQLLNHPDNFMSNINISPMKNSFYDRYERFLNICFFCMDK